MLQKNVSPNWMILAIKAHLRYKTKTSQNVPPKAQIKNFLFLRKIMFHSQDIQVFVFFNHTMIYQISDVTMSISAWDKVHF